MEYGYSSVKYKNKYNMEKTPYSVETHIEDRIGYIEGVGQLCKSCYNQGINRSTLLVPGWVIEDTPNDNELGVKVREMYWSNKNGG